MQKRISVIVLCICLFAVTAATCYAEESYRILFKASEEAIQQILQEMDITYDKGYNGEDPYYVFQLGARTSSYDVVLLSYDRGDSLQLYAGFAMDTAPSLEIINEWNKANRFSRAYVDGEGDPCLESDLDLAGGVAPQAIEKFISLFEISLVAFVSHLSQGL